MLWNFFQRNVCIYVHGSLYSWQPWNWETGYFLEPILSSVLQMGRKGIKHYVIQHRKAGVSLVQIPQHNSLEISYAYVNPWHIQSQGQSAFKWQRWFAKGASNVSRSPLFQDFQDSQSSLKTFNVHLDIPYNFTAATLVCLWYAQLPSPQM